MDDILDLLEPKPKDTLKYKKLAIIFWMILLPLGLLFILLHWPNGSTLTLIAFSGLTAHSFNNLVGKYFTSILGVTFSYAWLVPIYYFTTNFHLKTIIYFFLFSVIQFGIIKLTEFLRNKKN